MRRFTDNLLGEGRMFHDGTEEVEKLVEDFRDVTYDLCHANGLKLPHVWLSRFQEPTEYYCSATTAPPFLIYRILGRRSIEPTAIFLLGVPKESWPWVAGHELAHLQTTHPEFIRKVCTPQDVLKMYRHNGEFRADAKSVQYSLKAGYSRLSIWAGIKAFDLVRKSSWGSDDEESDTHPSWAMRKQKMKELLDITYVDERNIGIKVAYESCFVANGYGCCYDVIKVRIRED